MAGPVLWTCEGLNLAIGTQILLDDARLSIHADERGITAKDSVRIFDGKFTVYSGKSPIRAKNKKDAEKGYVLILGGSFFLHTDSAEDAD